MAAPASATAWSCSPEPPLTPICPHYFSVFFERYSPGKDHDPSMIRSMEYRRTAPRLGVVSEIFGRDIEGARRARLVLADPDQRSLSDESDIFDRIEFCHRHSIATLLSTNGTFLDERLAGRVLDSPLDEITLSFDGAKKETFEFYRKGAKFEKVRDNFVRFARMKHERRSKLQVVVQMVCMEGNAGEVGDFLAFWSALPRVDQVRIKEDETNLMRPDAGHAAEDWKHPCHYLWRGPMYVKQNGDVYPCCQSYMLDGAPLGNLADQSLVN